MATDWRITTQRQTDELMDNGSFDPHMEVNFEVLPEGTKGQIKVSLRNYTAEMVRSMIQQRVDAIKEIANL